MALDRLRFMHPARMVRKVLRPIILVDLRFMAALLLPDIQRRLLATTLLEGSRVEVAANQLQTRRSHRVSRNWNDLAKG